MNVQVHLDARHGVRPPGIIWKKSHFHRSGVCKVWFQAPSSVSAPRNDLHLLKMLEDFPSKEISTAATTIFSRHPWYLSETLVGFAFFDNQ